MGILGDLWWLSGLVLAAPLAVISVEYVGQGEQLWGAFFVLVALAALLLPEYIRWRLFGGSSVLARAPLVGGKVGEEE